MPDSLLKIGFVLCWKSYSAPFEVVPYTEEPFSHHWWTPHTPWINRSLSNIPLTIIGLHLSMYVWISCDIGSLMWSNKMLTKIVGGQQICRHFEFFCSSLGGGTASQLSFTKVHNQNHISTYTRFSFRWHSISKKRSVKWLKQQIIYWLKRGSGQSVKVIQVHNWSSVIIRNQDGQQSSLHNMFQVFS